MNYLGKLPPKHMFYLYESMIEPILLNGYASIIVDGAAKENLVHFN